MQLKKSKEKGWGDKMKGCFLLLLLWLLYMLSQVKFYEKERYHYIDYINHEGRLVRHFIK